MLQDSCGLMILKKCFLVSHTGKSDKTDDKTSTGNNVSVTMFPSSPRALVLDHLKFKLSVSCCIYLTGLTEGFKLMCAKTQLRSCHIVSINFQCVRPCFLRIIISIFEVASQCSRSSQCSQPDDLVPLCKYCSLTQTIDC